MVLHNPNNWHWVNKDVREWTKEYLNEHLLPLKAEKGDVSAKLTKIFGMEGDVDVSQREGKVITLFDVKLDLEFEGTIKDPNRSTGWTSWLMSAGATKEDTGVTGTISIPEVAHDTEEDEYVVCSLCPEPHTHLLSRG